MPKLNLVMDTSQYDMFRLCEARFNMRYNMNKTLPTKNTALDRGTLVHLAAETYYQCLKDGSKYDYAVGSALLKVKEAGTLESDLSVEDINVVVDTMEQYFDYWRVADQGFEIVEVERPFMYLLYEDDDIRIYMAGKIDLLINDDRYTNMPMDHKSFSRTFETGRMSNQFKNYCTATSSNYLLVNKIGFQKTLPPEKKFIRVPLSYDHLILDDWKANTIKVLMHYVNCVAEGYWPLNETSCDKFNRRCEYYEVCDSSGVEAKFFKLNANYIEVSPWDVSAVLRKTSEMLKKND